MTCYWAATAGPAPAHPPLDADTRCEIAIIGGGFTGLAAADSLRSRGRDVVLLEAKDIGWGASGRSGGSVTPRYKMAFRELAGTYGDPTARRLHELLHGGVATIKENVRRYELACDFRECGQATAAHSTAALQTLREDVDWLRGIGDEIPRLLDRKESAERFGLDFYRGAYLDIRGARFHPLKYVRGLAQALVRRGLRVHAQTPVTAIGGSEGAFAVRTGRGATVAARHVVLATDAYLSSDLKLGSFREHFLTVGSALIATAPLSEHALREILPGRHVVADTFALLNYYQILPDGSLLFGGRGKVTPREDNPAVYELLERRMRQLFPAVGETAVIHRWSGLVGLSQDNLPHATTLAPGLHAAFGYGGRGVVLSHVLGQALCGAVMGDDPAGFGPLASGLPKPFRFHGLKRHAIGAAIRYFAVRDWLQARLG